MGNWKIEIKKKHLNERFSFLSQISFNIMYTMRKGESSQIPKAEVFEISDDCSKISKTLILVIGNLEDWKSKNFWQASHRIFQVLNSQNTPMRIYTYTHYTMVRTWCMMRLALYKIIHTPHSSLNI